MNRHLEIVVYLFSVAFSFLGFEECKKNGPFALPIFVVLLLNLTVVYLIVLLKCLFLVLWFCGSDLKILCSGGGVHFYCRSCSFKLTKNHFR